MRRGVGEGHLHGLSCVDADDDPEEGGDDGDDDGMGESDQEASTAHERMLAQWEQRIMAEARGAEGASEEVDGRKGRVSCEMTARRAEEEFMADQVAKGAATAHERMLVQRGRLQEVWRSGG